MNFIKAEEHYTFLLYLLPTQLQDLLQQLLSRRLLDLPLVNSLLPHLLHLRITDRLHLLLASLLLLAQLLQILAVATILFAKLLLLTTTITIK